MNEEEFYLRGARRRTQRRMSALRRQRRKDVLLNSLSLLLWVFVIYMIVLGFTAGH